MHGPPSASEAATRLGRADSGASTSSSVSTTSGGERERYYEARGEHIELVSKEETD